MPFFQCTGCMKKFSDQRGELRLACPFCHRAVLPIPGTPHMRISNHPLMVIHGTRLYQSSEAARSSGLSQHRAELEQILFRMDAEQILQQQWRRAEIAITRWFFKYKEWESRDTFDAAFADNRMVVRYGKRALDQVLEPLQASDRRSPRVSEHTDLTLDNERTAVGMLSILQRSDPFNFEGNGPSRKYELGLHDLSASLLTSRLRISQQTFNAPTANEEFVFISLSRPQDQQLFHRLNSLAKTLRRGNPELHMTVAYIRARMTRIKLASSMDMGTNFAVVGQRRGGGPKLKYLPGKKLKQRGRLLPRTTDFERDIPRLRHSALNFPSILPPPGWNPNTRYVNEITVAVRHHSGPFPVFAVWNATHSRFDIQSLRPNDTAMTPTGGTISDQGHLG